jgi:hypothetical protein
MPSSKESSLFCLLLGRRLLTFDFSWHKIYMPITAKNDGNVVWKVARAGAIIHEIDTKVFLYIWG